MNEGKGRRRGDQRKDSGKLLSRECHLTCFNEIPLLLWREETKKGQGQKKEERFRGYCTNPGK